RPAHPRHPPARDLALAVGLPAFPARLGRGACRRLRLARRRRIRLDARLHLPRRRLPLSPAGVLLEDPVGQPGGVRISDSPAAGATMKQASSPTLKTPRRPRRPPPSASGMKEEEVIRAWLTAGWWGMLALWTFGLLSTFPVE